MPRRRRRPTGPSLTTLANLTSTTLPFDRCLTSTEWEKSLPSSSETDCELRRALLEDLIGLLTIEKEVLKTADGPFVGMTFCVTGTLSVPRKEIQQRILDGGGKDVGSVSAKLNVLVAGEKAGSKLTKATSLGVVVWSEDDLNGQLETTTEPGVSGGSAGRHCEQRTIFAL